MASSFEIKSTRPSVGETIVTIVRDHIDYRKQIFKLAGSDLRRTYRASALGWSWAIIKPLVTIFVYWFAFAAAAISRATRSCCGSSAASCRGFI